MADHVTTKPFWQSKTVIANILAVLAIAIQTQTGYVLSPDVQIALLGLINLLLRAVTGTAVSWSSTDQH